MKWRRKGVFWAVVVLAVVAILWLAFRPRAVKVETARVHRGPLVERVGSEADTRVKERYLVTAPVSGEMDRVTLSAGDPVKPGDLLAHIHGGPPAPLDARTRTQARAALQAAGAAITQADALVQRSRSLLDQAERELTRRRELAAKGVIAPTALEQAETEAAARRREHDAARAAAAAARAERERAEAALVGAATGGRQGAVEVRAPVGGQVLRVMRESSGAVAAGAPLLEIGDTHAIEIVAQLLSADAMRVRPGADVRVTDWGGDRPLGGRVDRIEPAGFTKVSALGVEEKRVNVIIELTDPAAPAFGDDYRVQVHITVWSGTDIVQAPATALFRRGDAWAVFAVANGRAQERVVAIGHGDDTWTEIREGLAPGEEVIVQPPDRVDDGDRVRGSGAAMPQ